MYANTQYRPAAQQWTTLDPNLSQNFVSNKLTQTRGGSQVLETQQPTKPGIGGKLSNIAHRVGERFSGNANSRWSAFGLPEALLQEYTAKTAYGNNRIGGWIFLSQGHFGWISYTDSQNRVIKTLIPWSNVTDIVPTARVRGQATKTYQFSPILAPGTAAEGFQIFTKDNLIYQFFGLKKNIEQLFNFFNQLWTPVYGTRPGFTSGLHHGGFARGFNNGGMTQTGYGQTGLATGLAQPGMYNAGTATTTTYAQPAYGQTGIAQTGHVGHYGHGQTGHIGHQGVVGQPGLVQTGMYNAGTTTTYTQPATYGQTGLVGQPGLGQTGLVGQHGFAGQHGLVGQAQPAVYGQGLSGQPGLAQTGVYNAGTTTTYVQSAPYGQSGLVGQHGLVGQAQPAVYGQGLSGQAYAANSVLTKEGYVQPQTGMALGQTAPTNYRNL